jgi:Lrp/AsnC family transcriptional regulator for asnA, asnC and gidA
MTFMDENYQIDSTDKQILRLLQEDARRPFLDVARKIKVSGGTIHQRIEKLKEAGIITGSTITVDYKKLGKNVTVLLGIHLKNAKDINLVIKKLNLLDEVIEAYYTTGNYALIIKILMEDIDDFHDFLVNKLQKIDEIQSTESFICLKQVIKKDIVFK